MLFSRAFVVFELVNQKSKRHTIKTIHLRVVWFYLLVVDIASDVAKFCAVSSSIIKNT